MIRLKRKYIAVFAIAIVAVAAVAWYQSLPLPHGPITPMTFWTEYILTKNGNHTQIQSIYSDGGGVTEQVNWLNFDNRTAVYHYFGCLPSQPNCTLDGCSFNVLNDTPSEYRVRVICPPGA